MYAGRLGLALCSAAGLSVQFLTFTFSPILHVSCGTRGTGVCRKTGISAVIRCWRVCTVSSYGTRADTTSIIVQFTVITWNKSVFFNPFYSDGLSHTSSPWRKKSTTPFYKLFRRGKNNLSSFLFSNAFSVRFYVKKNFNLIISK